MERTQDGPRVTETTYDPDARRETPLAVALKERIRHQGPLSVREYMAACLYDPDHGYYRTRTAIGRQGDFITAPEVSQVFGELIGLWSAVVWQQMGSPASFDLIEIGPGRGTLMRDALRAVRRVPGVLEAARVGLIEISETLSSAQRITLAEAEIPITWAPSFDALTRAGESPPPAIVVANELLDCEPRDQMIRSEGTWQQRTVTLDDGGRLSFAARKPDAESEALLPELDRIHPAAAEGDVVEPSRTTWLLDALADRSSLAALLIDYGHTEPLIGDTLQAVRAHRYEHPLTSPGEADLTMQVDFASFAERVRERTPFATDGPVTQGEFLGALGAVERTSRLMAANPSRAGEIEAGIARLMSPTGMGTRFKAIGLRSRNLQPLPGLAPMDIASPRK
jgi:NADH dehydrogenase [ubiquinone] 1 alpha subcomplex assembly factor 7